MPWDTPVAELDALTATADERDFETVAQQVREAIEKNRPEAALDRLHTFVIKYLRTVRASRCRDQSRQGAAQHLRRVREALARRRALNYEESLLIFNHVASSVRFIKSLEVRAKPATSSQTNTDFDDDSPF